MLSETLACTLQMMSWSPAVFQLWGLASDFCREPSVGPRERCNRHQVKWAAVETQLPLANHNLAVICIGY